MSYCNRNQIFFHDSDKLVIARLSRTIWPIFCSFLIFYCYFTRLKAREISPAKYEKLGKYWLYCTRNRAITNAYFFELLFLPHNSYIYILNFELVSKRDFISITGNSCKKIWLAWTSHVILFVLVTMYIS